MLIQVEMHPEADQIRSEETAVRSDRGGKSQKLLKLKVRGADTYRSPSPYAHRRKHRLSI